MHTVSPSIKSNHMHRLVSGLLLALAVLLFFTSCPVKKSIETLLGGTEAPVSRPSGFSKALSSSANLQQKCACLFKSKVERVNIHISQAPSFVQVCLVLFTFIPLASLALLALLYNSLLAHFSKAALTLTEPPLYIRHRLLRI